MKKNTKTLFLFAIIAQLLMSSCGLFKKKCDCPKFGKAPASQAATKASA